MKLLSIFLAFTSFGATAQGSDGLMDFNISTDSPIVSDTSTIALKSTCFNRMNTNLILYGIDFTMKNIPVDPDSLCRSGARTNSGVAIFFYNEACKRIYPRRKRSTFDYKPMPRERMDSVLLAGKRAYLKGTGIAKALSISFFEHRLDLKDYDLRKGKYVLQLVYFAGEQTFERIDAEQIKIDLDKYNAQVFQGCIISNKVFVEIR